MKNSFAMLWNNIYREKSLLLLCFLLAFFAWQGIRKNIGFEVMVSNVIVDVEVPEGYAVLEKSVHQVNVLFRGSREAIRYLNNDQLRVVIPISKLNPGQEARVKLSKKYIKNPTSAEVVQFDPSEIIIKLDQKDSRLLPVKAAMDGSLPEGLEIDRIICKPASVRISGAKQVLDKMENFHTEPVALNNRQVSFKESLPVSLPRASRVQVEPDWISVEFVLIEHSSEKIFKEVPLKIVRATDDQRKIEITPESINIEIKGQQKQIEKVRPTDVFAYINCSELNENANYDVPVDVYLPDGINLVKTTPAIVNVKISDIN